MKAKRIRCLRKSEVLSDSDDENHDDTSSTPLEDQSDVVFAIRQVQHLRKRPAGLSLQALSTGKEIAHVKSTLKSDPFKLKTGGLVNMRIVTSGKVGEGNDEDEDDVEARLAKTFATETNKRDEDAEMIKYIEEELEKRKGLVKPVVKKTDRASDLLADVPDHLKPTVGQKHEDMISNQMLCGIPEVDLGVEAKMKNIEATEEAKRHLVNKRFNRNTGEFDGMAPVNVAANFVHYNRSTNYTNVISSRAEHDNKRDLIKMSKSDGGDTKNADEDKSENRIPNLNYLHNEKSSDTIVMKRYRNYMRSLRQ